MTEYLDTSVQEGFRSPGHVKEHDGIGGEFMFAEELQVEPSLDQENALVIFKLQGSQDRRRCFKAVKASPDTVKKFLEQMKQMGGV